MFALKKLLYRDYPGDDFLDLHQGEEGPVRKGPRGKLARRRRDRRGPLPGGLRLYARHRGGRIGRGGRRGVHVPVLLRRPGSRSPVRKACSPCADEAGTSSWASWPPSSDVRPCPPRSSCARTSCRSSAARTPWGALPGSGPTAHGGRSWARGRGYAGDPGCIGDLAAHILVTALSFQLPDGALDGLEGRVSPQHGQFCLNIVHDWMDDQATSGELFELCRLVESSCNLEMRFRQCDSGALADADIFPCINERIVSELAQSMAGGSFRADEARSVLQRRRDLHWHTRIEPYLDAIEAAADAQAFQRDHAQGFPPGNPEGGLVRLLRPQGRMVAHGRRPTAGSAAPWTRRSSPPSTSPAT